MLVDDSSLFLNAAIEFLTAQKDVVVVGATDGGQEALARVQDLRPQVILIDMAMPGMPGLEAIPRLRRVVPDAGIIALTVMDTKSFREAALAAGADAFIPKSAMRLTLLSAIRRLAKDQVKRGRTKAVIVQPHSGEAMPLRPILLMEDDTSQRHLYAKVLRNAGYGVYEAATIQEARDLLAENRFGIFLCDIHMGQERGTDLVREQREVLAESGTQVVMISADTRYRAICQEMGVRSYLEKPVSLVQLVEVLNGLTRGQQEQERSAMPELHPGFF
jgi:DNA-binding NarL/FixJ family response regulator